MRFEKKIRDTTFLVRLQGIFLVLVDHARALSGGKGRQIIAMNELIMENNFQEMPALKPISEIKMDSNEGIEDAGSMHGKKIMIYAILKIDSHSIRL